MEVPRYWRLNKQRYRLVGERCPHCQEKIFPPRDICPRCGGGTLKENLEMQIGHEAERVDDLDKITISVGHE